MSEILEALNEEQLAAVKCLEGPMLIVAGAGSGKTRVLTSRIAYLIEQGVPPERILALTFTKKAAGEMKDRIALMVGERKARRLWMGTFHSVFIRFLRDYAEYLHFPKSFTIYDTSDSVSASKTWMQLIEQESRGFIKFDPKDYKPKDILSRISHAKNNLVTPKPYEEGVGGYRQDDNRKKRGNVYLIYKSYCQYCKRSGVMDFDDILLYMNVLLRDNRDALEEISSRFDYILVDEYQDTNHAQYRIIKELADKHKNLCVVGDDSQSIYGFRGAQIQNILNFQKDFPMARLFRLERNYRSTSNIVNAANALIAHNEGRIPKNCVSMGEEGEKIKLVHAFKGENEAEEIAFSITERIRREKCEYQDFAVLYRTNSQSRTIEEKLRFRNIPYTVFGSSFYDRLEVKDVLAYLKLVVNPSDNESFKRIVNKPTRGIGDTSILSLEKASNALQLSLFDTVFADGLASYGLKNAAIQRLRTFCLMIKQYTDQVSTTPAMEIARGIIDDSGLYMYYKSEERSEEQDRLANVEEVLNAIASKQQDIINDALQENPDKRPPVLFLSDYLEDIALLSSIDNDDKSSTLQNTVKLMTIHTAKGLEFAHVFVPGMEENLFPSGGWQLSIPELEEERRLFYVAMTRAKKSLTLLYVSERFRNGKTEYNSPSRFLRELAPQYLDHPLLRDEHKQSSWDGDDFGSSRGFRFGSGSRWPVKPAMTEKSSVRNVIPEPVREASHKPFIPEKPAVIDPNFVPEPMTSFKVGDCIEHNRFGEGTVLEITGQVPDLKAKIRFTQYGDKLLILKFAKLRHKV